MDAYEILAIGSSLLGVGAVIVAVATGLNHSEDPAYQARKRRQAETADLRRAGRRYRRRAWMREWFCGGDQ